MMEIQPFSFDKNKMGGLITQACTAIRTACLALPSRMQSSRKAPADFATRPTIPSWEEYESASNGQILDRLHRNPAGLLNEQPFIDTLMNVRNAENTRKQTRHLVVGFYILALSAFVLAFRNSPAPTPQPQGQTAEQQRAQEKALENAVGLLKEEFNVKLQSRDLEVKDLKHQISLLNQAQSESNRQIKSLAKSTLTHAPVAAKPLPATVPPTHPKPAATPKPPTPPKPSKPSKPN